MLVRDDFTWKSGINFLVNKSDAYLGVRNFLSDISADGKVHVVRTDNGGEFRGRFSELCSEHSIRQEFSPSDCSQANLFAERAIAVSW